jgi:hypothetical protein
LAAHVDGVIIGAYKAVRVTGAAAGRTLIKPADATAANTIAQTFGITVNSTVAVPNNVYGSLAYVVTSGVALVEARAAGYTPGTDSPLYVFTSGAGTACLYADLTVGVHYVCALGVLLHTGMIAANSYPIQLAGAAFGQGLTLQPLLKP